MKKTCSIFTAFIILFIWQKILAEPVFNYMLLFQEQIVYCGITNDPVTRAEEHKDKELFYFDKMVVYFMHATREKALEEETKCIYRNPIASMYQTYPRDETAIARYEAQLNAPKYYKDFVPVVFTQTLKNYLSRLGIDYKELY